MQNQYGLPFGGEQSNAQFYNNLLTRLLQLEIAVADLQQQLASLSFPGKRDLS